VEEHINDIAGQLHYSMAKNTAEDTNVALSLNRMVTFNKT
jgi:hypothetical protein